MTDSPKLSNYRGQPSDTDASMLSGMRDSKSDERQRDCWGRFDEKYRELLCLYVRRRGLQVSDAEDVVAEVLLAVRERMETFQYDATKTGGFLAYLKRAAKNAVRKYFEKKQSSRMVHSNRVVFDQVTSQAIADRVPGRGTSVDEIGLERVTSWRKVQELEKGVNRFLDEIIDFDLQQQAQTRVRGQVSMRDWHIFVQLTEFQKEPNVLANELGTTCGAIYTAKNRVLKKFKAEVRKINLRGFEE